MKSESLSVAEYMTTLPPARLEAMKKIRELCQTSLPNHEENMRYKMPSYVRNNQVQVAFASQKQHIVVYFLIHEVMLNHTARLTGLNHGKGAIRFSNPDKIDYDILQFLLEETAKSDSTIC